MLRTMCIVVLWVFVSLLLVSCDMGFDKMTKVVGYDGKNLCCGYLRCEYRVDPYGIDVLKPRLSWVVGSGQRNQKQTAYHVLVASSREKLSLEKADLWDSGKVVSDETACVIYEGRPLASHVQCYWKVKVWDKDDIGSSWSEPALWTMGLLNPSGWKAKWIGYNIRESKAFLEKQSELTGSQTDEKQKILVLPPPVYLRREFSLVKPVKRAVVYASSLGLYELHLNGKRIGGDYFTPGWTDYNKRVYYNTYDVTEYLRGENNALGAVIADGWYSGYVGYGQMRDHYGKQTCLLAQLHIEYNDGSSEIVASDHSWKAATGPLEEADFLMGEMYDARKEISGWDKGGFDESGWRRVEVFDDVQAEVQAYPGVTVRKFAEIKPVEITEPKNGHYVFNMGTNFAGWVRLKVNGKKGDKIILRFAERLNPDGTIYTENLRSARATDTYICRGDGEEIWEPRFTFHGFQYVEVAGYPTRPGPKAITGIEITSAAPVVGHFECNDKIANQLYHNICQTQRSNFIDIPTDCPQRDERLGWTGDAQAYIRTACMNNDTQAFFTKWLRDLRDGQRSDGQFPMVAPVKVADNDGGPAWADAGTICPWTTYQVYGDRRVLEESYPSMERFIAFCKDRCQEGLLPPKEFHCFGDWLNINDDTPKEVIYMAYFAYSTKLTAQTAEALGKKEDAKKYYSLFEDIKASFNKAYVQDDGQVHGNSQTAYVLALKCDLLDEPMRSKAAENLVKRIKECNWHLSTGFVGTKDLMLVLADIGRNDLAYRLFHNETFPSWGFSIEHGATSIWERWDGWTPDKGFQDPGMNSFAHYSFGAVGQWMFENIAGIRTDGIGYKKIVIKPYVGGKLSWADTSYNSIHGLIVSNWKIDNDSFKFKVVIPANTTAVVYIPAEDKNNVYEETKPIYKAHGVTLLAEGKGYVVCKVGSGDYQFRSKFLKGGFPK